VVGWWPSHPAEPLRGAMVSDLYQKSVGPLGKPWPLPAGGIHPPPLAAELGPLRIHPHEIEGEMLRAFVPDAPEIDQSEDKRLETLAKILAECASVQAAATHILAAGRDWDFCAIYQDAIDHFCHAFMRYHPPRLDWVSPHDFAMYSQVVGGAYVFHDTMLGVLLELALQRYAVELLMQEGFTVMTTPDLARDTILEGTGFMPRGPETQIYSITGSDLSLVATAEITLGGAFHERIFDAAELLLKRASELTGVDPRSGTAGLPDPVWVSHLAAAAGFDPQRVLAWMPVVAWARS